MFTSQSYLILISRMLERAAYYGFRSIFLLCLLTYLSGNSYSAVPIYAALPAMTFCFSPIGGLIGDFGLGSRNTAILGAALQTIGIVLLCFSSEHALYACALTTGLGTALYSPNSIALAAKEYNTQPNRLDSGFTMFYSVINLGALIGTIVLAFFISTDISKWIIIALAIVAALAIIPLIFVKNTATTSTHTTADTGNKNAPLFITLAILLPALYWYLFEMGYTNDFTVKSVDLNKLITDDEALRLGIPQLVNLLSVVVLGIVFAFIWFYVKLESFLKIGIGFILGGLGFLLIYFIPYDLNSGHLPLYFTSMLVFCLSEVFLAPIALSTVARFTKPKYYALVFSAFITSSWLLKNVFDFFFFQKSGLGEAIQFSSGITIISALILIGIVVIILAVATKKPTNV